MMICMEPDEVRNDWATRSGKYSPAYYAEEGPNIVSETIVDVVSHYGSEDAEILEIGCGSGRHLAHIRAHGFSNLTGIDINESSFTVMEETYPKLSSTGTFHTGAIEELIGEFETGRFDIVFSVETLQHIHPDDEWVFEECLRITDDLLLTAENEGNSPNRGRKETPVSYVDDSFPLYHRNWKQVFTELGAAQLIRKPTSRDTIRVFRSI